MTDRLDAFYRDHVARTNPDPRKDEPTLEPAVLHRDGTECRIPEWIKRRNQQGLPAKDMTGRVAV